MDEKDFFVGIHEPSDIRRNVLESSKDVVNSMQTNEILKQIRKEKLLLFDMCAHTGDTLRPIINLLKYNEYNVVVGIAQKNPLFEEIVFDFIALNRECRLKCSPFGIEHMVSKNGFKMLSSPNQNKGNAIQLRKQISKIIDEFS